jgi:DnaJ-class molecular chaperone
MKRPRDSNYYELLEIRRDASLQQIRTAYVLAQKTYKEKNLGTLSLFDDEERKWIWGKVEEAYQVLSDFGKRKRYDLFLATGGISFDLSSGPGREEDNAPLSFPEEISGLFLKTLREKRGVTLENVVSQTRIAINHLIAIEEDRFKNFPPEVYLRSYLNEYSKYLKLDPKTVTEGYFKHYRSHLNQKK